MAVVGRVARAHGIRGQVIVNPETDFPEERFRQGAELFVRRPGTTAADAMVVTTSRMHQGRPVIGLRGIDDMNAAIALAGAEIRVPVEQLVALPEGSFYRHELVGCRVETAGGEHVGTVTAVEGDAARSRLVVSADGGEILVPLAVEICTSIDPEARRIVIAPPEGLLELNVSPGGSQKAGRRGSP